MDQTPADYRFLLANERTFLAYVRTALALQVAGLGVLQFLTHGDDAVRYGLGFVLVVVGSYVGWAGNVRYRSNERIIRAGGDMAAGRPTTVVTVIVALVPLAAVVVIVLGNVL